jgi:geranylgeranyl pyrophosphate synthase
MPLNVEGYRLLSMDVSANGALEDFISQQLSGSHWVDGLARELFASGGKRVRSKLTLKVAEVLQIPHEMALPWAAANELLHNASLVHDDIQDQDRIRRGRPTMWVQHGLDVAISVGDYLLMKPFLLVSAMKVPAEARVELNHMISEAVARMAVAQVEERQLRNSLAAKDLRKLYLHVVSGKTSSLFDLPVTGLAVLADFSQADRAKVSQAFDIFGHFFQVWDDLKDFLGLKSKAKIGEDLREGKVTAVVTVFSQLYPEKVMALESFLSRPERSEDEVLQWVAEMCRPEVIRKTREWLDELWSEFEAIVPQVFHRHGLPQEFRQWVEVI